MATISKIPELKMLPIQDTVKERSLLIHRLTHDLPKTGKKSLQMIDIIGSGTFGKVHLCRKDWQLIVFKELFRNSEERSIKLFMKEAKLLHSIKHPNIVRFHSIYEDAEDSLLTKIGFIMEYVQVHFSFEPFKIQKSVSSLCDFLEVVDLYDCKSIEHCATFIARDTANALAYLHSKDIVHRDLKPDNVLVSNSHYVGLADREVNNLWATEPIRVKLTDLGESRAKLIQTNTLVHSVTKNLHRGSPVFMAPELLLSSDEQSLSINGLKTCDLWSYSMILFTIMNPELKFPFYTEMKAKSNTADHNMNNLKDIIRLQRLPNQGTKYAALKDTQWSEVYKVYNQCAKFVDRPTAQEVVSYFDNKQEKERKIFADFATLVIDSSSRTQPERLYKRGSDMQVDEPASDYLGDNNSEMTTDCYYASAGSGGSGSERELNVLKQDDRRDKEVKIKMKSKTKSKNSDSKKSKNSDSKKVQRLMTDYKSETLKKQPTTNKKKNSQSTGASIDDSDNGEGHRNSRNVPRSQPERLYQRGSDMDTERYRRGYPRTQPERLYKRGSDMDTERYRRGYPDKKDEEKTSNLNLLFYTNEIESRPDGDKIDKIHKKWLGNYDLLEQHHGYIQWLFPIRECGMNYQAEQLQLHEAKAIIKDKAAHKRVLLSYKMMLDFYGMKLKNEETGEVERSKNWKERFAHLNRSMHNYLRITRILKSLGEFDYEHLKSPLVKFVINEALEKRTLKNVINSCKNYWIGTIKDDEEREELLNLVKAKHHQFYDDDSD